MSMNDENNTNKTNNDEIAILNEIEQTLSISIPQTNYIGNGKTGYKLSHNHIIGLSISSVSCQKVLEKLFTLTHLEKLVLNDTEIVSIPESISNLKNLSELSLKNNLLETVPEALLDLPHLKTLILNKNKLHTLKTKEGQLALVKTLEIENNLLKTVDFAENSAFVLEGLFLSNNEITELNISNLVNLKYMSVQYNNLTEIPRIRNLTNLNTVELDFNAIKEFNITELDINKIVNFSITYNKIPVIDFNIAKKIDYFIYDGNPLDKKSTKQLKQIAKSKPSNFFYS